MREKGEGDDARDARRWPGSSRGQAFDSAPCPAPGFGRRKDEGTRKISRSRTVSLSENPSEMRSIPLLLYPSPPVCPASITNAISNVAANRPSAISFAHSKKGLTNRHRTSHKAARNRRRPTPQEPLQPQQSHRPFLRPHIRLGHPPPIDALRVPLGRREDEPVQERVDECLVESVSEGRHAVAVDSVRDSADGQRGGGGRGGGGEGGGGGGGGVGAEVNDRGLEARFDDVESVLIVSS